MPTRTAPCDECGADLPYEIHEAIELLYHATRLEGGTLAAAIGRAIKRADQDDTDDTIGDVAVSTWLGVDLADLVAAVRHCDGGECERVGDARLAMQPVEACD
jgi:hypothetical protein